jgi:hypothetical protein
LGISTLELASVKEYVVSERFLRRVFYSEQGVEPIIVSDGLPEADPKVMFLVRYIIGEGAGGEIRRPIFRSELAGYDYGARLDYPIQDRGLENLQFLMEPYIYGTATGDRHVVIIQSPAPNSSRSVKVIVSRQLVEELMRLYDYAW